MMIAITKPRRFSLALFALSTLLVMTARPAVARQQVVDLVVDPGSPTGLAGADLRVTGSVTNTGTTSLDLENVYFNLLNGPASADLTSAIFFSSYAAPLTLAPGQIYTGTLFTLGTDPGAHDGPYTGNITLQYGDQVVGQDIGMMIVPPNQANAVPEPGTFVLLLPALGLLTLAVRRRSTARP